MKVTVEEVNESKGETIMLENQGLKFGCRVNSKSTLN